jgi:hypothetical protein
MMWLRSSQRVVEVNEEVMVNTSSKCEGFLYWLFSKKCVVNQRAAKNTSVKRNMVLDWACLYHVPSPVVTPNR